ncbi:MAG: hypothetical protein V8S87_04260 [Oscillospiraceae bacterium]
MDPETGNLIRAGVPAILNPLDANALSAAVKVKETYGADITLITMGPPAAEAVLRECLAVGADKAILVTTALSATPIPSQRAIPSSPPRTPRAKFDLIFCGKETLDGATGQMGSQLAERFDAAQITSASLIKDIDLENKKLTVSASLRTGRRRLRSPCPASSPWKRKLSSPPSQPQTGWPPRKPS